MSRTRRSFFKTAGAGLAAVATPPAAAAVVDSPAGANNDEVAMLYDATKCVGCKACMSACKRVNAESGALGFEQASFDEDA